MPRYAVLLYWPEAATPGYGTPEFQKMANAYSSFTAEIGKAGIMKSSEGLQPTSTATTVRVREGKTLTTDGPFAETREQLGGVWLFECQDLDEAISWAAKIPQAQNGSVEIRPLWQQSTKSGNQ
ncbi:MAG TPA: YciI family protein [Chloroflexota bacterium]|nr:YciI family protein [Chloroflexota bacterium]